MGTEVEPRRESRVGKRPVPLPKGVTVSLSPGVVSLKGSKGELTLKLPATVIVEEQAGALTVGSTAAGKDAPRLQGLGRALVNNMVTGVSEGYVRTLELVGTGYRCEVKGTVVHLSLGLSHPVVYQLPAGVAGEVSKDSKGGVLHLSSADRAAVGQAAARIRSFRPPEPYGGKGVRYRGENVRRKAGKSGKK